MNKREEAIYKAENNLNELSLYYKFGIPSIVETTQSGNVSVISINSDKPEGSGIYQNPIIRALNMEEETIAFIDQQLAYIELLPSDYKKIIVYKYLKNISIHKMLHYVEFEYYTKNTLYKMLNDALEMIAVFDKQIDYTVKDYVSVHVRKKNCNKENYIFSNGSDES